MNSVLRKSGIFVMAILMGVMLCSVAATAGVIYTTLGPGGSYDNSSGFYVDGANYNNQVLANLFSLGSGATVTDAVLGIGYIAGNNSPVNLYIESDVGGVPGSILSTFTQVGTIPAFGSGGLVTFNCVSGCTLTTGGSYFLVAWEPDAGSQQAWNYAYGDTSGNNAYNQVGSPTGPWIPGFYTNTAFEIDGTLAVPEPTTLATLFGFGIFNLAAVFGFRRKLI